MIQLVLRNLISNAIKFTGEGGTIKISLNTFESNFEIRVEDTGIGMSEEDQGKLFSNKNHFTTRGTNNEKGTGLGLLLCKEFIEKNGGSIALSSQEGKGSTFSIKLVKEIPLHEEVLI
jgi:signal transduction histidine kinase